MKRMVIVVLAVLAIVFGTVWVKVASAEDMLIGDESNNKWKYEIGVGAGNYQPNLKKLNEVLKLGSVADDVLSSNLPGFPTTIEASLKFVSPQQLGGWKIGVDVDYWRGQEARGVSDSDFKAWAMAILLNIEQNIPIFKSFSGSFGIGAGIYSLNAKYETTNRYGITSIYESGYPVLEMIAKVGVNYLLPEPFQGFGIGLEIKYFLEPKYYHVYEKQIVNNKVVQTQDYNVDFGLTGINPSLSVMYQF